MQIDGLSMILLYVKDPEHSVEWYHELFGFEVLRRHGDFIVLEANGVRLGLHPSQRATIDLNNRGCLPVLRVSNFEEAKAEIKEKGCSFVYENRTPRSVFGTILDPDGIPIQILQAL